MRKTKPCKGRSSEPLPIWYLVDRDSVPAAHGKNCAGIMWVTLENETRLEIESI
jgi:hypothetical protein